MESNLGLVLEQSWDINMDPLMVLIMEIFGGYFLENHWDILMVKCLALIG